MLACDVDTKLVLLVITVRNWEMLQTVNLVTTSIWLVLFTGVYLNVHVFSDVPIDGAVLV